MPEADKADAEADAKKGKIKAVDLERLKKIAQWALVASPLFPLMAPLAIVMTGATREMLRWLTAHGKLTADDADNVVKIVRAGSESNVKRLKIKMNRENATGLDAALGRAKTSRPFRFNIGTRGDTQYEIYVEYIE